MTDLIVRLPNWVGDVVMATPALQALKESGIELALVGKPWIKSLLAALDMQLYPFAKGFWQTTKVFSTIRSTQKALILPNSLSSALTARLAGKLPIGYKLGGRQLFLNAGISAKPRAIHEVNYFWNIAHFAHEHWFPHLAWPEQIPHKIALPVSSLSMTSARQHLQKAGIDASFLVLCPFAHGTGKNKQSKIWPHWLALSKQLQQHYTLVVCPGKNEEKFCAQFAPEVKILSNLDLGEYAGVLALAEQVVANDSGPMHIAAAVCHRTLGIFGVSDPLRTSPWGAEYIGREGCWPSVGEVLKRVVG